MNISWKENLRLHPSVIWVITLEKYKSYFIVDYIVAYIYFFT